VGAHPLQRHRQKHTRKTNQAVRSTHFHGPDATPKAGAMERTSAKGVCIAASNNGCSTFGTETPPSICQ
jgi:hypothetical protein